MENEEISSRLRMVFSTVFKIPEETLPANPRINELPEWDSLTHLCLIMSVEKEFNRHFKTEQISKMLSLSEFIKVIQRA
jgi:acyl carrier protein